MHRDVKPGNLLLNSRGQVKLADFGVARKLGGTSDLSKTFVGTVGYMSPERIQGLRYNVKADIWGFGLSLMACALGRFPYQVRTDGRGGCMCVYIYMRYVGVSAGHTDVNLL